MPDLTIPFQRTVCACSQCVQCCKEQPGFLVPGDTERIVAFTGKPAKEILASSEGGVVMDTVTRITRRIRTIIPQCDKTGRCIFLSQDNNCLIHPVSPFGCAYADTHMSYKKGHERSLWGMQAVEDEEYQALRKTLPLAKHYKPRKFLICPK